MLARGTPLSTAGYQCQVSSQPWVVDGAPSWPWVLDQAPSWTWVVDQVHGWPWVVDQAPSWSFMVDQAYSWPWMVDQVHSWHRAWLQTANPSTMINNCMVQEAEVRSSTSILTWKYQYLHGICKKLGAGLRYLARAIRLRFFPT